MPAPTLPLDDNTLFILLALRYNDEGCVEIKGGDKTIYDWNVNYNDTLIEQISTGNDINDYANAGIKWIKDKFGVTVEPAESHLKLSLNDKTALENFLEEYLKDFPPDEDAYYDEERHKEYFYHFIKKHNPEFNENFKENIGKYFIYKLLPESDVEKYKMVEYIGYLANKNILLADNITFECKFQEKGEWKKSIRLRFKDERLGFDFFKEFFNKEEKLLKIAEFNKKFPIIESEKWKLFNGNIIYNKELERESTLAPRVFKILKLLIKRCQSGTPQISIQQYMNAIGVAESTAKTDLAGFNKRLKSALHLAKDYPLLVLKSLGDGTYKIIV